MLAIKTVAGYLPAKTISNYDRKEKFQIDDNFIENKIGVRRLKVRESDEKASDFCVKAYENLLKKSDVKSEAIDCCVVVTQNPDYKLPCTATIVHGKLGLPENCACFDISLGCSGYIYGLSNIIAFMKSNNLKNGLLFTSDIFSDIIDHDDKSTALILGDGASVTYISDDGGWLPGNFSFWTRGSGYKEIICDDHLFMNGRSVYEFASTTVSKHIKNFLSENNLEDGDIDKYILHQGSKYIVDTICKKLSVESSKVPYDISEYGNTAASTVPLVLEKEIDKTENNKMLLCGFGVGLSWGSAIIERRARH